MSLFRVSFGLVGRSQRRTVGDRLSYQGGRRVSADVARIWDHKAEEVVFEGVLLPLGAPEGWSEPAVLAAAIEEAEARRDAQLCRTVEISIPREVPQHLWPAFAAGLMSEEVREGYAVSLAVQNIPASDGLPNPHVHAAVSLRQVVDGEFSRRKARTFRLEPARLTRARYATRMSVVGAALGAALALDPRSNAERGLPPPDARVKDDRALLELERTRAMRRARARVRPRMPGGPLRVTPACTVHGSPELRRSHLARAFDELGKRCAGPQDNAIHFRDGGAVTVSPEAVTIVPSPMAVSAASDLCEEAGWLMVCVHGNQIAVDGLITALYSRPAPIGVVNRRLSNVASKAFARTHGPRILNGSAASETATPVPAGEHLTAGEVETPSPRNDTEPAAPHLDRQPPETEWSFEDMPIPAPAVAPDRQASDAWATSFRREHDRKLSEAESIARRMAAKGYGPRPASSKSPFAPQNAAASSEPTTDGRG